MIFFARVSKIMDESNFLNTVILTATVFAALISSIANIIISLINNHRLKSLESKKQLNDIDKYRYSRLYELVLKWPEYDSEDSGETTSEMAHNRMLVLFLDDGRRYALAKPLLDSYYIEKLETKKAECDKLLKQLISAESADGQHSEDFLMIKDCYFRASTEFSEMLKASINDQLDSLLRKSNTK